MIARGHGSQQSWFARTTVRPEARQAPVNARRLSASPQNGVVRLLERTPERAEEDDQSVGIRCDVSATGQSTTPPPPAPGLPARPISVLLRQPPDISKRPATTPETFNDRHRTQRQQYPR
jgi:hypothetical protein